MKLALNLQNDFSLIQFFKRDRSQLFKTLLVSFKKYTRKRTYNKSGSVFLVGAGCGDPELLTVKAARIIRSADVIFYDSLISQDLIKSFPGHIKKHYVGKRCGAHSVRQKEICQLILDAALEGLSVVRLKGGDPSIFGRLAEETDILTQHNIPFAIIPGVTAASGCAAYSGIALTHRDYAQSVRFVTAHMKDAKLQADWADHASSKDTIVFYMGLSRIDEIVTQLCLHGMDSETPIAIIDKGTSSEQQVITSVLNEVTVALKSVEFTGPALIIVGHVVAARQNVDLSLLQFQDAALIKSNVKNAI